jgi:membrane-associated protease RseP (regulator of RpoE activity)
MLISINAPAPRPARLWREIIRKEPVMTINVGTVDRILRVIVGLLLIAFALGYIWPGTGWNWVGWIGVVPILTAVFSTCPAYSVLGLSTK